MDGFKLYFKYISYSLQSQMQYRASFIMMSIANFFTSFIDFLGIWALFSRFGTLKGFTISEVALFYGMVHIAFSIAEAGARGFDVFARQVISGDFDRILLRPRSTVLQILGQEFQLMRIGRFTQGLIVLLWAAATINLKWTVIKVLFIIVSILGGSLLFSGIFILQATLCFWSTQSLEVVNMVTYGGVETAQFPLSIYKEGLRNFFTFIIPLACINYFPVMGILNKSNYLGSPNWVSYLSPLAGVLFFVISLKVWSFGVKHYRSTGS